MKSKRFLLINIAVLALNILLISLSVILLPGSSCCFGQSYGFHPVKIEAPHFSCVGQLRFFFFKGFPYASRALKIVTLSGSAVKDSRPPSGSTCW